MIIQLAVLSSIVIPLALVYLLSISVKKCREYETMYIEYKMRWKASKTEVSRCKQKILELKRLEKKHHA